MRELDDVLETLEATGGRGVAVATVVAARGSTYRREGARLVVSAEGDQVVGNISGGCLEGDVIANAGEVLASAQPRLLHFDLTADDEAVWGWGLGCNGAIDVLVEPGEAAARFAPALAAARREQRAVVLATVIEGDRVGARLLVHPDGRAEGDAGEDVRQAALDVLAGRRSATLPVGGSDRVFFEVIVPRPRLVVCGAGHDAIPLVALADRMGWLVEVVDDRRGLLVPDRFPGASRLVLSPALDAAASVGTDPDTSVVVMSHNFLRDADYLRSFAAAPLRYLGMLGPRARLEKLADEARRAGTPVDGATVAAVHGPAGLDLGADGPEEIALAIVGELLAVRRGRSGGFLRDRPGPIHAAHRTPVPSASEA